MHGLYLWLEVGAGCVGSRAFNSMELEDKLSISTHATGNVNAISNHCMIPMRMADIECVKPGLFTRIKMTFMSCTLDEP